MVQGQVPFKAWHISWKKEQKLGFFPWKKNNRITFHRIFVLIWKLIFKICEGEFNFLCFVILRGFIYKLCNASSMAPFLIYIALQVHPNFQHKFLHFEIHPLQNPRIFLKKEQNLYFKELKEHFWSKSVLYQTIKTKERLYHSWKC